MQKKFNYYSFSAKYIDQFRKYCKNQLTNNFIENLNNFLSSLTKPNLNDNDFIPDLMINKCSYISSGINFFYSQSIYPINYKEIKKYVNEKIFNYYELVKQSNDNYTWGWFIILLTHTKFFNSFAFPLSNQIIEIIGPFLCNKKIVKIFKKFLPNYLNLLKNNLPKKSIFLKFNKEKFIRFERKIHIFYPIKKPTIIHLFLNPKNKSKNLKNSFTYSLKKFNRKEIYRFLKEIFIFIKKEFNFIKIPTFDFLLNNLYKNEFVNYLIFSILTIYLKNKKINWDKTNRFIYHLYIKKKKEQRFTFGDILKLWKTTKNYLN